MIVVSDTSPLTYLHQIGRLSILKTLYGEIIIPPAVEAELRAAPQFHEDLDWTVLRVVAPNSTERLNELLVELDRGESEAIVVALELRADLLLIDESSGREASRRMGIPITGLLGVLLEAKGQGLVASVTDDIKTLVDSTTFRIQPEVRDEIQRLGGE